MKYLKLLLFFTLFLSYCKQVTDSLDNTPPYDYVYIYDYEYEYSRFFFIDTYYKDHFEDGFKVDPSMFIYESNKRILDLNVYVTTSYAAEDARSAVATIYPDSFKNYKLDQFDNIQEIPTITEKGYFRLLDPDDEYTFDPYKGYITLTKKLSNQTILSVAYRTEEKQVGTLLEDIEEINTLVISRLIKASPTYPTDEHLWNLTMRNVYVLPDSIYGEDIKNIDIENYDIGPVSYQMYEPKKSFINLLGWDVLDEDGNKLNDGDGKLDKNPNLIDINNGIFMFPSLNPFNPDSNSAFQISEFNRAEIYDIYQTNIMQLHAKSKFWMKLSLLKNNKQIAHYNKSLKPNRSRRA